MNNINKLISVVTLVLILSSTSFAANPGIRVADDAMPQCVELVKDCLDDSDNLKSACFFSVAKHPFCEGSTLGDYSLKRWVMSPKRFGEKSTAPAFLGPKVINEKCINKMDQKFATELEKDSVSEKTIEAYTKSLDDCGKEVSEKLTRP